MNTKTNCLILAVALACSGAAIGQDAMTEAQVREQLARDGYKEIEDIEMDDGVWTAEAESADGEDRLVRIDPKTGKTYVEETVSRLSEDEVKVLLANSGYTNIHDLEYDDGLWSAEADDPSGTDVEVMIDPSTGQVIGSEKD